MTDRIWAAIVGMFLWERGGGRDVSIMNGIGGKVPRMRAGWWYANPVERTPSGLSGTSPGTVIDRSEGLFF